MYTIQPSAMQLLISLYNSPQRHYHDLNHINYGLSKFAEYKSQNIISHSDSRAIIHSWWFHDAIYSPYPYYGESSNEKESAKLFEYWLINNTTAFDGGSINEKHLLTKRAQEVSYNIQMTEFHLHDNTEFNFESTPILLDIDMAGFGRDFNSVYDDSAKILAEYEILGYDEISMLKARVDFLNKLLSKERIYYTEYFYDTYEKIARSNVEGVIECTMSQIS